MKKYIALIISLAMILACAPAFTLTALAEGEAVTLIVNSETVDDSANRASDAQYKTIAGALAKAESGDTIKLASNIAEDVTIETGKTLVLDLNGHVLKGTGNSSVITVNDNASLTVKDSSTSDNTHYFTVQSSGLWKWDDSKTTGAIAYESLTERPAANAVIAVKGGAITGGAGVTKGGGIILNGSSGTFTLDSGNIIGNLSTNDGGGIYTANRTINIQGGLIAGNLTAASGGGVYINNNKLTMSDGSVSFNRADRWGGGINANHGINSYFEMTGGTISYNYAGETSGGVLVCINGLMTGGKIIGNTSVDAAGGVYLENNLTLGGTVEISGNKKTDGTNNNLYLENKGIATISTTNPLTTSTPIGVNRQTPPTAGNAVNITGDNGANDYSSYFISDNANDYSVIHKDGKEQLSRDVAASITKSGTTTYFATVQKAVDAAVPADKDTVKMLRNVAENLTIASDDQLTLDLNGHVLKGTGNSSVIVNNGTLTIKDSSPDTVHHFTENDGLWVWDSTETATTHVIKGGCITGGINVIESIATFGGGIVNDGKDTSLTLKGGYVVGNQATQGAGVANRAGIFVMDGGKITGNKGDSAGVNNTTCDYAEKNGDPTFTMNNGEICANQGTGVLISTGSFNMKGGKITGNIGKGVEKGSGATINLGGSATIKDNGNENLYISIEEKNNYKILSGFHGKVGISLVSQEGISYEPYWITTPTTGVFITGNDADYSSYFFSDNPKYMIQDTETHELKLVSHVHDSVTFDQILTQTSQNISYTSNVANVVLGGNVTLTTDITVNAGDTLNLCLNGFALKGTGTGSVINNNGTLNIYDEATGTKHYFKVNADGLWVLESTEPASVDYTFDAENGLRKGGQATDDIPATNKIIEVSGGCITGGTGSTDKNGGGIFNDGTLTVSGGSIVGNKADSYGGGIHGKSGAVTINGGCVVGNVAAANGGGINLNGGSSLTISSGEIIGNKAAGDVWKTGNGGGVNSRAADVTINMEGGIISGNSAKLGGGVMNGGTFTMTGGTISDNKASTNGGGVMNGGTMTVGGTAKITDNTAGTTPTANNLYLPDGKTVTVDGAKALTTGASIGVTTETAPTAGTPVNITGSNGTNDYSSYFVSDNTAYEIVENGKATALVVAVGIPVAQITTGTGSEAVTKKFATVQKAVDFAGTTATTITMIANSTENVTIASGQTITLDLNGKVLKGKTATNGVIQNLGDALTATLTIKDSGATVEHKYVVDANGLWNWNDSAEGTATAYENLTARPAENAVIIVKGGAITGGDSSSYGGAIYNNDAGKLTIAGGNIVGNKTATQGGTVESSGDIKMTGGRIIGNTTAGEGTVRVSSKNFNMEDGEISFNTAWAGGAVYVNSSSVAFNMKNGKLRYNKATDRAGAVDCENGSFHMYGGEITGNEAVHNGGGVSNASSPESFHMHGGSITGNHAGGVGGGLYTERDDCTFDGKCIVSGNTSGTDKHADNVYVYNTTVSIGAGSSNETYEGKGTLLAGSSIGVTTAATPTAGNAVNITSSSTNDYSSYFVSDNTAYEIVENGKATALVVAVGIPVAQITTGTGSEAVTKKFATVQKAVNFAGTTATTITMIANSTENVTIASGQTITLDLNGFVLKGTGNSSVITNSGALTVKDSNTGSQTHNFKVGSDGLWTLTTDAKTVDFESLTARLAANAVVAVKGGAITGGQTDHYGGGINNTNNTSTLTLQGVNIVGNKAENFGGGICNEGTAYLNGGNIAGNVALIGGGVANGEDEKHDPIFIMSGNSCIMGNTAGLGGGGVVNAAIFTMNDNSSVIGNTASGIGGGVYNYYTMTISGTAKIADNTAGTMPTANNLYLSNGKTVTVDSTKALTTGASIGVTTETAPTSATPVQFTSNGAVADAQYFHSDVIGYEVKFNTNHLELAVKPAYQWYYDYTEGDYIISNVDELEAFADLVNSGVNDFDGKTVRLSDSYKNVKMDGTTSAELTTPIGLSKQFKGSFEGNGKEVKLNILVTASSGSQMDAFAGLFGSVNGGSIRNVGVSGTVEAEADDHNGFVGGIVGYLEGGSVVNCYSAAEITLNSPEKECSSAGGIVGFNQGSVGNCFATGAVTGSSNKEIYLAMVVGGNEGTVTNCYYPETATIPGSYGVTAFITALPISQMQAIAKQDQGTDWVALGTYGKVSMVDALNEYVGTNEDYLHWGIMTSGNFPAFMDKSIWIKDDKAYNDTSCESANEVAFPAGISYDSTKKEYTFENVSYSSTIYFNTDGMVKIVLKGTNRIGTLADTTKKVCQGGNIYYAQYGIYSNKVNGQPGELGLTFTGDGSLTIYDSETGIEAENIIFDENFTGTVTINDYGATESKPVCCLKATYSVTIKNGTFVLNNANTNGISADTVTISGGKISAKGGTKAISAATTLSIDPKLEVTGAAEADPYTVNKLTNNNTDPYVVIDKAATGCTYWVEKPLAAGENVTLMINGKALEESFTLAKKDNGWTIKKGEKFLSFNETTKALEESNTAFVWTNNGCALFAQVKTRCMRPGWFGWWRPAVHTTNYYLTTDKDGKLTVTTERSTVKLGEQVTADEHKYVYTDLGEDGHSAICSRCGDKITTEAHTEGDTCTKCGYAKAGTITVNCGVEYEPGYWFFWWSHPSYTAWADVQCKGAKIAKIEISADGKTYRNGQYFTSHRKVTEFFVRVTDSDGNETVWQYKDGKTNQIAKEGKAIYG